MRVGSIVVPVMGPIMGPMVCPVMSRVVCPVVGKLCREWMPRGGARMSERHGRDRERVGHIYE